MSQTDQLIVQNQLSLAKNYINTQEENLEHIKFAIECLKKCDLVLKKNIRETFNNQSPDIIIEFCEVALQIPGQESLAEHYINLFFQRNTSKGQMFVRALLIKAQLTHMEGEDKYLKGEEKIQNLEKALTYVKEALNIVSSPENKQKYAFLIYNTSVCVYNIIRKYIKQNWIQNFTEFVEKIDKLFDEVDDPDYNWRCRYGWLLFYCLYDQDKKQDALKVIDKLWDTTKKKGHCNFQDQLFRLRIHLGKENANILKICKTDADQNQAKGWTLLLTLQMMRSGLIPEAQIEKELINVINSMNSSIIPGNEIGNSSKLTPIVQERLAEAGRIALQHNLITIADNITNFLGKENQLSIKPSIMHEYNKAELYIKKAGPLIDSKTGMRLNSNQIKQQEVERRIEALKILEKVTITARKACDADLVYDGAVLIWNIGLPFLNATYKHHVYKAFQSACKLLADIQSTDHALRVNFHLELAKIDYNDDIVSAEKHVYQALALDYSIPVQKIQVKFEKDEDLSIYQRPYEKYLVQLQDKIRLKQNIYDQPRDILERVTLDLEAAQNSKSQNMKIDILQKSLGLLVNLEDREYYVDPSKNLVEEEIEKEKVKHNQKNLWISKQKKLLAGQIAKMAFDWEFNEIAIKANEFVLADNWQPQNAEEMILVQVECCYNMAQIKIDQLKAENFEIAYKNPIRIDDDGSGDLEDDSLSNDKKEKVLTQKRQIMDYYLKGLKLAESIQQSWLVFNGAIYIWNNYLPIFRNPINDAKLLDEIAQVLKEFFETMKNSFKELEKKQIIDYDSNTKIQVNSNIGIVYARLMEGKSQYEEVMKVCEALLQLPLGSHTRKLINSIKARVAQSGGKGGAGAGGKAADKGKQGKGKEGQQPQGTSTEHVLFAVVSQLEVITNSTNSSQQNVQEIIKCFETLETWQAKENDETELELHAELWAKLGRLALNVETIQMYKYSLRCVEKSLSLLNKTNQNDLQSIPSSRIRWYSLAEYLYAENLVRMLNPETQETESQEQLLFHALKHAVEGANKGMKANMNSLVLDSAKMVWNICAKLQDSAVNRRALIKPIFSTLYYLKTCKEKSEPDLILLLSQLLFKGCIENDENQIGENVCDMVFELIPKAQQKPIWEAKMIFMSQQGKNELQALQNMKEADASLQSKVQIRLARASNNIHKQCQAYQRGIEILKKENSVEIVEVYIEFSEWLLRNDYDQKDAVEQLLLAADTLIEIELIENDEEENEEDEEGDERGSTVFSRSIQNKKNSRISRIGSPSQRTHKSKQGSVAGQSMASKKKSEAKDKKQKGQTSRSSRTGGARATKTIKSKQAKSIFTQREEEPMPENLNCAHYERLMRIHSMLAMISQSQEEQLQYCLDAKLFLTKIFEVSFKTLNTMAQNAANYTSKIDQKIQEKEKNDKDQKNAKKIEQSFQSDPFKKPEYIMPQSLEEWINFQFSKDFLEKVQQQEDYNFMCKFLFEKTEITYKYVDQLIDMFERAGLHAHCIPLYVFMRFFAKEIMGNQFLTILQDFKYARVLNLMGYHEQANKIIQSIQMNKLKLSEQERKQLLAKTENSKIIATTKKINDFIEQYIRAPNLIKEFQPYQIWIQLSIELYRKGDLVRARDLLNEAYKHAQIIQNKQLMGEIHLYLGMVSYLEGDYKESLENHMKSHKLIKDILLWELSLKETYKCLKKLNKYEDMRTFLRRILEVFESIQGNQTQSLAQQNNGTQQEKYKQQQQQQAYSTVPNKLQIEQMLTSTYLHFAKLSAKLLVKNYSAELLGQMMEYVRRALVHMGEGSADAEHYEIFLKIVFKIQVYLEGLNLNDKGQVNQGFQVAGRMIKLLNDLSLGIKSILKYSLVIEKQSDCKRTPLMMIYYQIRVYLASLYSTQGVIKQIKRKFDDNFKESEQSEKGHEEEDEIDEDEERDTMGDNNQNNQNQNQPGFLQRYLIRLQRQIDSVLTAIPKSLQDFQKAAAILVSVKNQIPKDSYLYLITLVELTRAKRLQLEKDQLLTRLWVTEEEFMQQQEDEDEDDYKQRIKPYNRQQKEELQDSIQYCKEISDNYYQYLTDPFQSKYINHYLKKFSMEVAENFGKKLPDYCFQYLAKYQSFEYNQFNIDLLKKALKSSHKFITYQRINKHVKKYTEQNNEDVIQALKQSESFKLWNQIYDIPDYNSIITDYIPNQQVQMLLKLSEDKRFLYFSYMAVQKNEENEGKREYKWFCKKKALNMEQYHKLEELNQRISDLKKVLIKTPIQSEKEFVKKFFEPQEQEFVQILEELENFCQFFTVELEELLHFVPENQNEEDENQQQQDQQQQSGKAAKKEAKKEAKKDTKKKGQAGGKDDLPVYESPLGKTKTGYESVLLLVDLFLFNLPFEALKVFKDVPAVARDFSILAQGKRLQAAGFSPSANNSTGIEKDKIKYISYNFKNSQKENEENKAQQMDVLNAKPVIDQFMQKNANSLKIEGKVSSKRVTSLGEWQQYLQNGSMLLFYGNPGLLNILSPKLFVDMSELSRVKSVILLDKINAKKQVLEKFSSLEQDGEKTPVTDSFIITAAILSLLGVQSIGQTQWSVEAEQYPKMLENFLEGASQEIYLASTLQKFREPSVFYRDQNGNLVDPVQIQKEKEEKEKAGKGAKKMGKKEEKDKDKEKDKEEADQVQIQEEIVEKKMLHLYNMVFIGVPVVRVQ